MVNISIGLSGKEKSSKWYDEDNRKNYGKFNDEWKHEAILPLVKKGVILDIGCNEGKLLAKLDGNITYGTDISKWIIKKAREKHPDIAFICSNAYCLPDIKFDTIIASDIIEHLEKPDMAVKIWLNHLKTGGRLIILTPNAMCERKLEMISRGIDITEPEAHINMFSFWSLSDLFSNMKNVEVIVINIVINRDMDENPKIAEFLLFVVDKCSG